MNLTGRLHFTGHLNFRARLVITPQFTLEG